MSRLPLRARLTLFVAVAFAVVITLIAVVALRRLEEGLVSDTRASAEAVLSQYLESINGGVATVGVVDEEEGTQFFYRDEAGRQLSEIQYFDLLADNLERDLISLGSTLAVFEVAEPGPPFSTGGFEANANAAALASDLLFDPVVVEPDTGQLVGDDGSALMFLAGPVVDGQPRPIDLGADLVAVSQRLVFSDGTAVEVGVSSSLRPVTDSLDAIRSLVWLAVPLLVLSVAAVTWLAASRALAPVSNVSSRARAISADNLDDRLPEPEANDPIRELVSTVNDMLDRLQHARDRQRQLVSDASHELRSPVAASRAQLEVAALNPSTTDWMATAATVLGEQERLSELIDDLLALAGLDEAGAPAQDAVDLRLVLDAELERPRCPKPRFTERPGVDGWVVGDPRLLARAIGNLLDNAARHANGRVEVALARTTSAVVVHVDDDGPGIPVEHREIVFDRFTRLDEARNGEHGGAGLGLAITQDIARAHHGHVDCATAPGGGARFTLSIPALEGGAGPH